MALTDDSGKPIARLRIDDTLACYQQLLELLTEYGDSELSPIRVAIETGRGLLVAFLRQGKRRAYALNPMSVARYRDRPSVSRKKSDTGDAHRQAPDAGDAPGHRPGPPSPRAAEHTVPSPSARRGFRAGSDGFRHHAGDAICPLIECSLRARSGPARPSQRESVASSSAGPGAAVLSAAWPAARSARSSSATS